MDRPITLSAVTALFIVLLIAIGAAAASGKWIAQYRAKQGDLSKSPVLQKLEVTTSNEQIAVAPLAEIESGSNVNAETQVLAGDHDRGGNTLDLSRIRAHTTTNTTGRKTYFFAELYGTDNQVIARDAEFRELLGYTKLAFRTSEGTRYYDLDDLHPEVIRSLGYDSTVLKRALAGEFRQRQIRAAEAEFQAALRVKAATELAERERAAAERTRAQSAIREAEARERIADAAERAATNPPRERIIQRYLIVPGGSRIITNAPIQPPAESTVSSPQPVDE